ncbi:MAG: rhodanese-like domain-containing protein [Desulfobulbaceae bacterium]|nr:rhodanese-like domain-containing protein [Desulfobulbaceae bacterium]HIJ78701.1 rhodanese-like domain-containing protein [Deltaproteobacteria bacterium]
MVVNEQFTQTPVTKLAPTEAWRLLSAERPFVLDVRPLDFTTNQSYIKGAIHCPLVDLIDRINELPKNRPLLICDWTMKQSPLAAIYLQSKGYNVLGVVKGGMERWLHENFPSEARMLP